MLTVIDADQLEAEPPDSLINLSKCDLSDFFRSMTTVKSQTSDALAKLRHLLRDELMTATHGRDHQ